MNFSDVIGAAVESQIFTYRISGNEEGVAVSKPWVVVPRRLPFTRSNDFALFVPIHEFAIVIPF